MGNTNCVASSGDWSHKQDISFINNTKYELNLNTNEVCGRNCGHKGFQILDGRFVEGYEPPRKIMPYSNGKFSVTSHNGKNFKRNAVVPKGKIFYINKDKNLKIIFEWYASGWTSMDRASATLAITGKPSGGVFIPPDPRGEVYIVNPKTWNQTSQTSADFTCWIYTEKRREKNVQICI